VDTLVARLATCIDGLLQLRPRVLVGIDGPDAAGKTTLADQLAAALGPRAARASTDCFHNPVAVRRHRGDLSPEGCYHDSFDYPALVHGLLAPFATGKAHVRTQQYDYRHEEAANVYLPIPAESALVFDGIFLLREELRRYWTVAVFLDVSPDVSLRRGVARDGRLFGSETEAERRYVMRYLPAQELYRAEADPERAAHVVVDNADPGAAVIIRWSVPTLNDL
jgi:uridine kinase